MTSPLSLSRKPPLKFNAGLYFFWAAMLSLSIQAETSRVQQTFNLALESTEMHNINTQMQFILT